MSTPYRPFGDPERMAATWGPAALPRAGASSSGCKTCTTEPGRRLGCCAVPPFWTLADLATLLVHDPDGQGFAARLLRQADVLEGGLALRPRPVRDKCPFHRRQGGCTLRPTFRPLRCRTYLCHPDALMPAAMVEGYRTYVATVQVQDEQLTWALWQQGLRLGQSSLPAIRAAALCHGQAISKPGEVGGEPALGPGRAAMA